MDTPDSPVWTVLAYAIGAAGLAIAAAGLWAWMRPTTDPRTAANVSRADEYDATMRQRRARPASLARRGLL